MLDGKSAIVPVRDVGVVHGRELVLRIAEHLLQRGVRLRHDAVATERDPDRRTLEDQAEAALRLPRRLRGRLEFPNQGDDPDHHEHRTDAPGPCERIDVDRAGDELLHDRGAEHRHDREPEQDHASNVERARPGHDEGAHRRMQRRCPGQDIGREPADVAPRPGHVVVGERGHDVPGVGEHQQPHRSARRIERE